MSDGQPSLGSAGLLNCLNAPCLPVLTLAFCAGPQVDGGLQFFPRFSRRSEASCDGSPSAASHTVLTSHGHCAAQNCHRFNPLRILLDRYLLTFQCSVGPAVIHLSLNTLKILFNFQVSLSAASTLRLTCLSASFRIDQCIWK